MAISSPLLRHVSAYVDGAFVVDVGDAADSVVVRNPADDDVLATLPASGAATTTLAIEAAAKALASSSSSSSSSLSARKATLLAIAKAHDDHVDELARIITLENGKPFAEAKGEVVYAAGFYRVAADVVDGLAPRLLEARPKGLSWTVYARPAGVVGVITPWNFPLAMLAKKLSGAIAAGAPVVVKPAEKTPLSTLALFHLLHELGLPKGSVNLVFGDAAAIGQTLCEHPDVRVISFTGSTRVGKLLAAQAAPHLKRLSLELGGNAPFIVCDDADVALAADELMASKFRCSGQTCVSANRVYVARAVHDAFVDAVGTRMRLLQLGPGLAPETTLGPLIDDQAAQKVSRLVADAVDGGAVVVVGHGGADGVARMYAPTLLTGVRDDMAIVHEEIFGPVVAVSVFDGDHDVVARANASAAGLAAYVFSADAARADAIAGALRFGHVGINTGTGPTPEAPFGGMKASGYGREGGHEGVMEFVELQTIPQRPGPGPNL